MTKAQGELKADIEKLEDENTIEKIRIFIAGMLAQQNIDAEIQCPQPEDACTLDTN